MPRVLTVNVFVMRTQLNSINFYSVTKVYLVFSLPSYSALIFETFDFFSSPIKVILTEGSEYSGLLLINLFQHSSVKFLDDYEKEKEWGL